MAATKFDERGFTLVELMVALTGGLFFSVFVFMMVRNTSRIYQQESRISAATLQVTNGFQRLKADVARAGFMSHPHLRGDVGQRFRCQDPTDTTAFKPNHAALQELASLYVDQTGGIATKPGWMTTNGIEPDRLILFGAYDSSDAFELRSFQSEGSLGTGVFRFYLQVASGAMQRVGYDSNPGVLASIFPAGQILRIVDNGGKEQYAVIHSVDVSDTAQPYIEAHTASTVALKVRAGSTGNCGLRKPESGALVNVVNVIEYALIPGGTVNSQTSLKANYGDFLYRSASGGTASNPYDLPDTRAELFRTPLDINLEPNYAASELIAEYAVDFAVGVTALTPTGIEYYPPRDDGVEQYAGRTTVDPSGSDSPNPIGRLRSLRLRLSTRSRAADRQFAPTAMASPPEAAVGSRLYRIQLGAASGPRGTPEFARVRTLEAEVLLRNQRGATW